MPVYFASGEDLGDVADAIREKLASTQSLEFPNGFVSAIQDIPSGGITPTGEKTINISANGTTTEDVTQYATAKVVTNVPASAVDTGTKNIATNGTHDVIGYASASVNVPASAVDSGTKSITSNGNNQDVVGYAAVNVNVPNTYSSGDEGKVVYNCALVAQTSGSVNADGTYDTTLINSMTVSVGGGGGSGYATGTITPSERTYTISFDTGLSTIHGIVIVPTDESPLKSNGRTMYGLIALTPGTTMIKSIALGSNNAGSSASVITPSNSATRFTQTGTSVTVTTQGVGSGYYWEAVTYTWYAW